MAFQFLLQQIILMLRRKKFIFYKYSVRTFTESRKRPFYVAERKVL